MSQTEHILQWVVRRCTQWIHTLRVTTDLASILHVLQRRR